MLKYNYKDLLKLFTIAELSQITKLSKSLICQLVNGYEPLLHNQKIVDTLLQPLLEKTKQNGRYKIV